MTNEEKIREAIINYLANAMPNLATGAGVMAFSSQSDSPVVGTIHPMHYDIEIKVRKRGR